MLERRILEALSRKSYNNVAELAAALEIPPSGEFLLVAASLKSRKLIHWIVGKGIKLSSKGYEVLLSKAANEPLDKADETSIQ